MLGGPRLPVLYVEGGGTQDGLSALSRRGGRVEVFASARTGLLRWYQREPGGAFHPERIDLPAPAGPPTALELADGRLAVLVRQAKTATILAYVQDRPDGGWRPKPVVDNKGAKQAPKAVTKKQQ